MAAQMVGARPHEIDIDVAAGEAIDFTVPVLEEGDVALNVTGWTVVAQVRPHAGGTLLHTFTLAVSSAGVRVTAAGAQTAVWASWPAPMARWDLWITPTAEESRPLARGRVFVRSPISEV